MESPPTEVSNKVGVI